MKNLFVLISTLLLSLPLYSFAQQAPNPFPRTIEVSGSAEMEVVPDEIYVRVVLREYTKRGEDKTELKIVQQRFFEACKKANVAESDVSLSDYDGTGYSLKKKGKNPDLVTTASYEIKFSEVKRIDDLVNVLDDEGTQSVDIVRVAHSKASQFRKELKIKAVQAAKDKAVYLSESIGEHVGVAITIKEPQENFVSSRYDNVRLSNSVSQSNVSVGNYFGRSSDSSEGIAFRKIKYRYEVEVLFALK